MRLPDGFSLLQKTMQRASSLTGVSRVLTVTNKEYYFQTREEYSHLKNLTVPMDYLLEPMGRNTAPAIALAAYWAKTYAPDATLLVLPADHLIEDLAGFEQTVEKALTLAEQGRLVTFGIQPDHPETGYGYIELGDANGVGHDIRRFVEKPDVETASQYLASGKFVWNAGMFAFKASVFLDALQTHCPDLCQMAAVCWEKTQETGVTPWLLDTGSFQQLQDISIDYAVMEKATNAAVIPAAFDWNDIGVWTAMESTLTPDAAGNRVDGEALLIDSQNCYVRSESRLVAGIGLEDMLIIDTADALLIAPKEKAQDVKKIVARLKASNHEAFRLHRTVHRPWGTYTILEDSPGYKIKRIVVKTGASLSLQLHHHRSEHWVVVSGTAKIVNGETEVLVRTNESAYIPAGTPHRLMNPGVIDCVMIEVQSGQYLGEDDIVRLEDNYGRL